MPSRKSQGSEDSNRPSLPRLASIASFQALNPFNRRRSNNTTDTSNATSSSKVSVTSRRTTSVGLRSFDASDSPTQNITYGPQPPPEPSTEPMPDLPSSKRANYMHLADEKASNLPRSRTFSNLPLPSRTKKPTSMVVSKSHNRLPSIIRPPSRIPSPPTTGRKHVGVGVGGTSAIGRVHISRQLQRSDTMPLLRVDAEESCHIPRSTAFKENVAFSPEKSTPKKGWRNAFRGPSTPAKIAAVGEGWLESQESLSGNTVQPQESLSSLPLSRYSRHPAFRAKPFLSSPAYKPSAERLPTPGAPVQRWTSQPVLVPQPNPRRSTHGEIKQPRLLSTRAPPTPPPPQTPLTISETAVPPARRQSTNNSSHIRQRSEQSPTLTNSSAGPGPSAPPPSLATTAPPSRANSPPPGTLSSYEPTAYWAGRFSALNDRYRNEELRSHFTPRASHTFQATSNDMHTPAATTARQRRALEFLHGLCITDEALNSFLVFQLYIAQQLTCSELARGFQSLHPLLHAQHEREKEWRDRGNVAKERAARSQAGIPTEPRTPVGVGVQVEATGSEGPPATSASAGSVTATVRSEGRKASFMERLLGRKKRPSGSEVTP
ncbi:hypothetical protein MBLNU230_g3418t1 [Neophaeotheca triangularis]